MSMAGVYIVMAVGMVVAFLTLIAEIYWKRRGTKKLYMNTSRKYEILIDFKKGYKCALAIAC